VNTKYEQVAFRTNMLREHSMELQRKCGAAPWVFDLVDAVHLFALPHLGDSFQVELAFNYTLLTDAELELIQLRHGLTVQLPLQADAGFADGPILNPQVLSHLGYHLPDVEGEAEQDQQMVAELQEWIRAGCPVHQISQTVVHKGTKRRYRYAFADTRKLVGVYTKVIQRLSFVSDEHSIARGREAFRWLADQS
jgi:hypothetical protein